MVPTLTPKPKPQVTWCEIDGDVVEAAKKYMPNVAIAVSTAACTQGFRLRACFAKPDRSSKHSKPLNPKL